MVGNLQGSFEVFNSQIFPHWHFCNVPVVVQDFSFFVLTPALIPMAVSTLVCPLWETDSIYSPSI